MTSLHTFADLARRLARDGAGAACDAEASLLLGRAASAPASRARALRRAALGLAMASRVLEPLGAGSPRPPFRPVGLRGAVAAGHVALAAGRTRLAELIGLAAAAAAPDQPAGLRLAGQALFAQGRFRAAARLLAHAVAQDPLDGLARALQAEALAFAGEPFEAARALVCARALGGEAAPLAAALEAALQVGALGRGGAAARGGA